MHSEKAISAYATKLLRGDGVTPTEGFTEVGEVTNIDGPSMSRETPGVGADTNGARVYIAGLLEGGEVNLDINFVPTEAAQSASAGLLKDFVDGTKRNFKIEFPTSPVTTWAFTAIISKFSPSAAIDKQLSASVTLKITGLPTLA